jgi:hypothetical protein
MTEPLDKVCIAFAQPMVVIGYRGFFIINNNKKIMWF